MRWLLPVLSLGCAPAHYVEAAQACDGSVHHELADECSATLRAHLTVLPSEGEAHFLATLRYTTAWTMDGWEPPAALGCPSHWPAEGCIYEHLAAVPFARFDAAVSIVDPDPADAAGIAWGQVFTGDNALPELTAPHLLFLLADDHDAIDGAAAVARGCDPDELGADGCESLRHFWTDFYPEHAR